MPRPDIPIVALIGRTNVGKSTLFNRLLERRKALVSSIAGTTRDRKEGECLWRGRVITAVDTGGLDVAGIDDIEINTVKQAELAIKQADIILFVVDLKTGALPQEKVLAEKLRKSKKPVIVVGNKAESLSVATTAENKEWKFSGLLAPFPVSALRGTGVGDLLDIVYDKLEAIGHPAAPQHQVDATRVTLIGRPNVGKSSIVNAILGEERFITSEIAHTTREPNDVLVELGDKSYILIDTAGMRRRSKVRSKGNKLEKAGIKKAEALLKHADVALFIIDIDQPMTTQDKTLAGYLKESKVGIVIVANKWDLIKEKDPGTINEFKKEFSRNFPFLKWAPIIFTSAKTKQRVKAIFDIIDKVEANRAIEIPNERMTNFLEQVMRHHAPKRGKTNIPPKILGLKQVASKPPLFELAIKAKRKDALATAYVRYLENQIRQHFDLQGTPISIKIKTL